MLHGERWSLHHCVLSHHSLTFWNIRSHGPASIPFHNGGVHGCCHAVKQRSGWGIIARWRPSFEHSDVRPPAEPFGFIGYDSVGFPWSSTYARGARLFVATSADALTNLDHGLFESESEVSVELGEVIGFGSFSTVYAGETVAGDSVAVKRVALKNTDDINRMRLQREIHILSSLEHPHVVRLRRVIQDEGFVSLVLDRCMGGELFDFVNDFQTFHANGERSWRRTNTTDMQTVTELHIAKMVPPQHPCLVGDHLAACVLARPLRACSPSVA